ncbi:hypothetical protein [Caulobacter segnis]|uniref:hypothetical protein n=1 Tax=Caulobacter segnis TaxID=88688 RepID=UPI00187F56BA|nr:hypothetical protein [Caulobacter segnis]
MWPVKPEHITLRVCEDLGWRVMVSCPRCRYAVEVNLRILAGSKYGALPVSGLLERALFKCRRAKSGSTPSCAGAPAERLSVSCMDVGNHRTVAEWVLLSPGAAARLTKCDLQRCVEPTPLSTR